MYGEPFSSSTRDASYDGTYYLTYDDAGDWYKIISQGGGYKEIETPPNISGTCLGDYTRYFCCNLGGNDGASFEKDEIRREDGHEWVGSGGSGFGGGRNEDRLGDFEYQSYCDVWEVTMSLYERIFGH